MIHYSFFISYFRRFLDNWSYYKNILKLNSTYSCVCNSFQVIIDFHNLDRYHEIFENKFDIAFCALGSSLSKADKVNNHQKSYSILSWNFLYFLDWIFHKSNVTFFFCRQNLNSLKRILLWNVPNFLLKQDVKIFIWVSTCDF